MMRWTPTVEKALHTATSLHAGQCRRGPGHCPFVVHPVCVALIASEYTDDENILAAALLHDTIEDTSYTEPQLREDFGARIAELVLGVTIPPVPVNQTISREERWRNSVQRYRDNLKRAPVECGIIAAADKVHNFFSTLDEYTTKKDLFLVDFGGTPAQRIEEYQLTIDVIQEKLGPSPLFDRLDEAWHKYETFVKTLAA